MRMACSQNSHGGKKFSRLHKLLLSIYFFKYAQFTRPLCKLISGENALKKNKAIGCDGEHEEAFKEQKEICTTTHILSYANFSKPFTMHIDACILGLGVILFQNQDGFAYVIEYASRSLSKTGAQASSL